MLTLALLFLFLAMGSEMVPNIVVEASTSGNCETPSSNSEGMCLPGYAWKCPEACKSKGFKDGGCHGLVHRRRCLCFPCPFFNP